MNYLQIKELTSDLLTEIVQLRFYRTHLIDQLSPVLKNVIVLKGLRGVGKTTALLQFLYQHKDQNVLYLPANSTLLGSDRLIDISKEFNSRGGGILVIDEIHKYPDWEIEVLDIVNFHSNIRLIISASSTLQIDHHLADLSRRHVMLNAFGLSFREWSEKNFGISLPVVTIDELRNNIEEVTFSVQKAFKAEKVAINEQFSIYLREGYFPTRDNYPSLTLYNQSIRNSVNAVIDQDIASRFRESTDLTHQNIKRLLSQIAKQCPFTPKMSMGLSLRDPHENTVVFYSVHLGISFL
jgi:predicted AAA+ superfamily ATPase